MQSLHKLCEKIEGEVQIIFWSNIFFLTTLLMDNITCEPVRKGMLK